MKRKVILALLATMTLTVGSLGTVFATESNQGITIQTSESEAHTHVWEDAYYVKDADPVYKTEEVIDQEEKWDWVTNIITPAWDEDITEVKTVCYLCQDQGINTYFANGKVEGTDISIIQHCKDNHGGASHYGQEEVVVDTIHHEAVTERVWTKVQDKISHFEDILVTPEKGHWEHKCTVCGEIQDRDTGKVIEQGTITTPENPDTEKPGDNTGNTGEDTQKPGTSTGDNTQTSTGNNTQTTTDDKTQSENENTSNAESTENKSEDQKQNENKEATTADSKEQNDTTVTVSTEKKAPKTGDTSSLIYLATLAGSAVTGGTAFGLRRKFKK